MAARIPRTRTTARQGVNAAQAFFESKGCVFQEVAQQNDFGKDAYVDLTRGGVLTPLCVALQIKSGTSYRGPDGNYLIPVDGHADSWRRSTIPVFGVVYDPADKTMRWVDLGGYLRRHPAQIAGSVPVPKEAVLDAESLSGEFGVAADRYSRGAADSISLSLLSPEDSLQAEAVFDAWALGRQDFRYLLLLRRLLLELRQDAIRRAIVALSHLGLHPDILWTAHNWIPSEVVAQVVPSFRWSPEEVAHMLLSIGAEEWGRGTLGQSFDVLMYEDPHVVGKLREAVGILAREPDLTAAVRAVTVTLAHARNSRRELARLIRKYPQLQGVQWFQDVAGEVQESGSLSLY